MANAELDGFPIAGTGTEKYALRDFRFRKGGLSIVGGDVETVTGIPGLAQKLETWVLTTEDDWDRQRLPRERRAPRSDPPKPWSPATPGDVPRRLRALLESESGRFFEAIEAARVIGDDLEVEFRAAGFPGSYLHRVALAGPLGVHEVVALPKATIFSVDRINDAVLAELAADPAGLDRHHDREFERVIARLVERMGYEVELTGRGGDDGVDIFAIRRDGLAPYLTVIDCKRYSREHRFGPVIVRTIAGVRD